MSTWTDRDLGAAFREVERVARERCAVGPVLVHDAAGWIVAGSVSGPAGELRSVRVVNLDLEAALVAFAERVGAVE